MSLWLVCVPSSSPDRNGTRSSPPGETEACSRGRRTASPGILLHSTHCQGFILHSTNSAATVLYCTVLYLHSAQCLTVLSPSRHPEILRVLMVLIVLRVLMVLIVLRVLMGLNWFIRALMGLQGS